MLYGFREGMEVTIVAADREEELTAFVDNAPAGLQLEEVDALSLMIDARFKGLRCAYRAPVQKLVDHEIEVIMVDVVRAFDVQRNMVQAGRDDPYQHGSVEERSIAEIYNIDKVDPWDTRTDEQKAQDVAMDKKRDEYRKSKGLQGESFSGSRGKTPGGEPQVGVTDVRGHRDANGNVIIDQVIAQKGLWDTDAKPKLVAHPGKYWQVTINQTMGYEAHELSTILSGRETVPYAPLFADSPVANTARLLFATEEEGLYYQEEFRQHFIHVASVELSAVDEFGDPVSQSRINNSSFAVYYRCDFHNYDRAMLDALVGQLPQLDMAKIALDRGSFDEDGSTGVWTVSGVQRVANRLEEAAKALDPALVTEVYAVNVDNERLVPKGTVYVDTVAEREIGPRPWNDRAAEWHAWTDEERAEEIKKNVKGDEFIYAGSWEPQRGSWFWIAPKDYFFTNEQMWSESLPIGDWFPADFEEIEPGVYKTRTRDWNEATFAVGQKGIRESMTLRVWLNHR